MNVWIMYDTVHGNGKILAEILRDNFLQDYTINLGDIKEIDVTTVVETEPDVLIVGGAIRMFRGATKSKKWLKSLDEALEKKGHTISYVMGFITHALETEKAQGWVKRYQKKFHNAKMFEKIYPEMLTARVETIEGPLFEDEIQKSKEFMKSFQEWISTSP